METKNTPEDSQYNEVFQPDVELNSPTPLLPKVYKSWPLTKMRYEFNVVEKNIFMKIVEVGQKFINRDFLGKDYNVQQIQDFDGETLKIEFPIKDITGTSHDYDRIRDNLKTLSKKSFGVPKEEGWDFSEIFLFQKIESSEKKGLIRVTLTGEFWKAFFNLKVFKVIDPSVAYKFRSVSTERIYEFLVGNKNAVTYEIENLKKMFCMETKYANNSHFIKYVIDTSQREMKELKGCPFYFEYTLGKSGRRYDKITFFVINKEDEEQKKQKFTELMNEAEGIVLSEQVSQTVKKCFPKLTMRDDVDLKLRRLQKQMGINALCTKIVEIYERGKNLKDNKELKVTLSAYFIGAIDREAEKKREEKKTPSFYTSRIQDAEIIDDGYEYLSLNDLNKKAKMLGMDVEKMIEVFKIERVDEDTWRNKIQTVK